MYRGKMLAEMARQIQSTCTNNECSENCSSQENESVSSVVTLITIKGDSITSQNVLIDKPKEPALMQEAEPSIKQGTENNTICDEGINSSRILQNLTNKAANSSRHQELTTTNFDFEDDENIKNSPHPGPSGRQSPLYEHSDEEWSVRHQELTTTNFDFEDENIENSPHPGPSGRQSPLDEHSDEEWSVRHQELTTTNFDFEEDENIKNSPHPGPSGRQSPLDEHSDEEWSNPQSSDDDTVSSTPSITEEAAIVNVIRQNDPNDHNMTEGRKRRKVAAPSKWKRNINKTLRMEGKSYLGFSKGESKKVEQNTHRDARQMQPTCKAALCRKSKLRHCSEFTDEIRKSIFDQFWKITWDQRRAFVCAHVPRIAKKKNTVNCNDSRRQYTLQYRLNCGHNLGQLQVCRQMYWLSHGAALGKTECVRYSKYRVISRNTRTDVNAKLEFLGNFLDSLPKMPSYYARKDSTKLLEPVFHTIMDVYKLYLAKCEEERVKPFTRKQFSEVLYERNIAILPNKKDQCNVCCSYKTGNITENEWQTHIEQKSKAREEKEKDKREAEAENQITLQLDMQVVKLAPFTPANAFYFKSKLCCHNLTVYNVATKHATCYWFSEDQNNSLVASTFASCLIDYLNRYCLTPNRKSITIYSDGCTGQNRNCIMANVLLNFSMLHKIEIRQKFLEVGHTQMEVDSVHACIERKLKNREIKLPSDYISITREARQVPTPYEAIACDFRFFKNYSTPLRYSSIRPGRVPNDPTVMDIKVLSYDPTGVIKVKLDHSQTEWMEIPVRVKSIPPVQSYPPLFTERCKINKIKWGQLQELKRVLALDC